MDSDNFIVYIKTDDIFKDIEEDREKSLRLQIMNQTVHCQNAKK